MPTQEKTKHTPGPWEFVGPNAAHPSRIGVSAMHGQVDVYGAPLTEETLGNARLIAAAPELLEALEAIMAMLQQGEDAWTADLDKAEAVIKKAKGTE